MRKSTRHDDGYALIEVMLGLMLIALLAAICLPGLVRATGPAVLRISALEVSALLRDDRNVALSSGHIVSTQFDADGIHSGATGQMVALPTGAAIRAPSRIRFMPDGHASGGDIIIGSQTARTIISVSEDTGAIHVSAP